MTPIMSPVPNYEHVQKQGAPRPIRHMHAADQNGNMPKSDCEEKRDPSNDEQTRHTTKIGA